jgi:tetratricopeptide (TPR) repeat protein
MVVDAVDLTSDHSRSANAVPIAGDESFLDHVHPTIEMHRVLAVAMIETMAEAGIVRPEEGWGQAAVERVAARAESDLDRGFYARALANLAMTLSWAGKDEYSARKALQALDLGLEDPRYSPTILAIVARQLALEGETEEALSYYLRAVRANPANPDVRMQIGLFLAGRDPEAATAHLFLASLIWSSNDETHRQLAFVLERRQRVGEAVISLHKASRLKPDDAGLARQISRLEARLPGWSEHERRVESDRYPSGSSRRVFQVRADSPVPVLDGIWTEWSPDGSLAAFAEYADGKLLSPLVRWDETGRRIVTDISASPTQLP